MTATELHIVRDTAESTSPSLQRLFAELVAFTLDIKQAHWNLAGPEFLSIDTLTDELVTDARIRADNVTACAGRALGSVDARPSAAVPGHVAVGRTADRQVLADLVELIDSVRATVSRSLGGLRHADPVAHGLTIEMLNGLARYRSMLAAQLADPKAPALPGGSPP